MAKSTGALLAVVAIVAAVAASGSRRTRPSGNGNGSPPPPPPPPPPSPDDCDGVSTGSFAGIDFLEVVPDGVDPDSPLPMIIALHGLGHDKEYLRGKLKGFTIPVRLIIPDAWYGRTGGRKGRRWWKGSHPGGLQAFMAEAIPEAADKLAPFVEGIAACLPTVGRPLIAGHSQGGYVALGFAATHPHLIRGSAPSAAWMPVAIWDNEPRAPVRAIHGKFDDGVPYKRSMEYYNEMIARGAPVHIRTTNAGHSLTARNREAWVEEMETLIVGVPIA